MSDELKKTIGELVGTATVCWSNIEGAGVFESEKAASILDQIYQAIESELNK